MKAKNLTITMIIGLWMNATAQTPLQSPTIISVSNISGDFDNNGGYEISWINNETPDNKVDSFVIYKYKSWNTQDNKPQYEEIAKIKNTGGTSFYRYVPSDELSKVVFFAVEAIPANKSLYSASSSNLTRVPWSNAPSNLLLTGTIDTCNSLFILRWNRFRGWDNISKYYFRIEYVENNSAPKILTIRGSEYLINDSTLTLPAAELTSFNFNNGSTYRFRVTALNFTTGYSCVSNVVSYIPSIPKVTSYINADGVKVISNNILEVTFSVEPGNELKNLVIQRSLFDSHDFDPIDTVQLLGDMATFRDSLPDLNKTHYYYKATLLNNCNASIGSLESNVATNILLNLTPPDPPSSTALLSWEFYRYFRGDVKEYVIYRIRKSGTEVVGTTTDNRLVDDLVTLSNKQVMEDICYQVEAVEENNPYGVNGHSWSNTVCLTIQANIEMPKYLLLGSDCKSKAEVPYMFPASAFTPTKFYMAIFDRWGTKVFETNDVTEGWDGTSQGRVVQQGGYMYYIRFSGSDNITKEQKGSFVVICPEKR
ncbi:MAG: gliding motility-associated C-terminal domain-containing protein [Bacteroidales bacterium]